MPSMRSSSQRASCAMWSDPCPGRIETPVLNECLMLDRDGKIWVVGIRTFQQTDLRPFEHGLSHGPLRIAALSCGRLAVCAREWSHRSLPH